MQRNLKTTIFSLLFTCLLAGIPVTGRAQTEPEHMRDPEAVRARIAEEVRHRLIMLPWYSVFDNLTYQVVGDQVTLAGQVTRPTLKSDAEATVKQIEGVASVTNEIEVLPVSPYDDRIRRATYQAIYRSDALFRYALQAVPPIHIIVNNGHVTLEGVVQNEMDRNVAGIQANGVSGVFSVTNNLQVVKK